MIPKRIEYSKEIAEQICELVALNTPIQHIAKMEDMPCAKTIYNWLQRHDDFRRQMEVARGFQADYQADEMLTLLKELDEKPNQAHAIRVKADILRWQAGVRAPRKYGELVRQQISVEAPKSPEEAEARIRQLEQELGITTSER